MVHTVVLAVHIAGGVAGLVFGLPAMWATVRGNQSTVVTAAYQAAIAVLAVTAVGLAIMNWHRLWPFAVIAVATESAAVGAGWAWRRQFVGWRPWHVRLTCGSYISLVTALLVVSWGSWLAWVLPAVVGGALVERAAARSDSQSQVSDL